jgi:hypothetical protein
LLGSLLFKKFTPIIILFALLVTNCTKESTHSLSSITPKEFIGKKLFQGWLATSKMDAPEKLLQAKFDISHMDEVFKHQGGGNYQSDLSVTGDKNEGIFQYIEDKTKYLGQDDMYILYTASHGSRQGLLDTEADQTASYEHLAEIISSIPAQEVLVFVMACYSGNLITALEKINETGELEKKFSGRTLFVMTSSGPNELSYSGPLTDSDEPIKAPGSGGSLFGYYLWKGLTGYAAKSDSRQVKIGELKEYVAENTKTGSRKRQNVKTFGFYDENLLLSENVDVITSPPSALVDLVAKLELDKQDIEEEISQTVSTEWNTQHEYIENLKKIVQATEKELLDINTQMLDFRMSHKDPDNSFMLLPKIKSIKVQPIIRNNEKFKVTFRYSVNSSTSGYVALKNSVYDTFAYQEIQLNPDDSSLTLELNHFKIPPSGKYIVEVKFLSSQNSELSYLSKAVEVADGNNQETDNIGSGN